MKKRTLMNVPSTIAEMKKNSMEEIPWSQRPSKWRIIRLFKHFIKAQFMTYGEVVKVYDNLKDYEIDFDSICLNRDKVVGKCNLKGFFVAMTMVMSGTISAITCITFFPYHNIDKFPEYIIVAKLFTCSTILVGMISFFLRSNMRRLVKCLWKHSKEAPQAVMTSEMIPAFLLRALKNTNNMVAGDESKLTIFKGLIGEKIKEGDGFIRRLREDARIDGAVPERIPNLIKMIESKLDRLNVCQKDLNLYLGELQTFFNDCRKSIEVIQQNLQTGDLTREAAHFCDTTGDLIAQANAAVKQSIIELGGCCEEMVNGISSAHINVNVDNDVETFSLTGDSIEFLEGNLERLRTAGLPKIPHRLQQAVALSG